MKKINVILLALILTGCATREPWQGFLQKENNAWLTYLDQTIDVDINNKPLDEILVAPIFPNFNSIMNQTETPDFRHLVTLKANGISRREALWRIAKQCNVQMTVEGSVVIIIPRK